VLRVRVLGGLAIEGYDLRALGSRKARVLLRRLAAAQGRPVDVDELAAAVWGDALPAAPHDQLSVLVSRLRGVLGPVRLRRGDTGYALAADWFDLADLEFRAGGIAERLRMGHGSAAFAAASAALALVRGPLLPEEPGSWAVGPRAAAAATVARVRRLAGESALAVGEPDRALQLAAALLDEDPFDEAAARLAMRAEVAAGRPAAALTAFERLRARLADDLGTDPAAATRDLHLAVLRGELRAPATGPPLVGRAEELRRLDAALDTAARGSATALVFEAAAGMGKSALLRAWTARAAERALVAQGRADPLGRDLPLQPIADALAGLVRARGAAVLGPEAALLGPLLTAETGPPVSTVSDAEAGWRSLLGALATVLDRAREGRPLVVVVDDLHLAGAGTGEFLGFLLRRTDRLAVVAARRPGPGPDLPAVPHLPLPPLTLADATALVGGERGRALHARSGGSPLFLLELARARDGELPESVVAAVTTELDRLGDAAELVRLAAVLGSTVDVDLLAALSGSPGEQVLDTVERAAGCGLLIPAGAGLAFAHEVVRDVVAQGMSPPRRAAVHARATELLAARGDADPLAVAHHARLGGRAELGAAALTVAAERAAARWQRGEAERLLDEALRLHPTPATRLARGRLRLARLDLDGARSDAERAIGDGAGAAAFELAGWAVYYARDFAAARRYADEGAARTADPAVRASCLALAGRLRHNRGELAAAQDLLSEAVAVAPASVRGVAQLWQAQLLVHTGHPGPALEVARRGLLDPHLGHPFAPLHGRFTVAFALAMTGRWDAAYDAVDDLARETDRIGDRRFPPVVANLRGWLLRAAGRLDAAAELHARSAEWSQVEDFREPVYAGLLDLTEDRFAAGDLAAAAAALQRCAGIAEWQGSMSWRHRHRHRLLLARLALRDGRPADAEEQALALAADAAARGDSRYAGRAGVLAATAGGRDDGMAALVGAFLPLAGPDGWRDLGELAAATGSDAVWHIAERRAHEVVAAARARPDGDAVARAVREQVERWRP
jgi:DNA-binding SARP family transcriptional activator